MAESAILSFGSGDGHVRQGRHLLSTRRRRLLAAIVTIASEHGARSASVGSICQRAGVSRRTFHELFADPEECLLAAFDDGLAQARDVLVKSAAGSSRWPERVRLAVAGLLAFLDTRPSLADFLFVQAPGAGPKVLGRRGEAIGSLVAAVHEEGARTATGPVVPLTAEGVVGAAVAVVHARLLEGRLTGEMGGLVELTGALTGLVVQPYLGSGAARRELEGSERALRSVDRPVGVEPVDPLRGLPIRLTYRTARVLGSIAAAPGASSKQVAVASGVTDEGQMSRLLARLERYELVCNAGGDPARGEARAWRLTTRGQDILHAVAQPGATGHR